MGSCILNLYEFLKSIQTNHPILKRAETVVVIAHHFGVAAARRTVSFFRNLGAGPVYLYLVLSDGRGTAALRALRRDGVWSKTRIQAFLYPEHGALVVSAVR